MDRKSWPAILTKMFRDVVGHAFGRNEDQHLGILLADLIEVLDEFVPLLKVAADLHNLLDIVVSCQLHGTDIDLNRVAKEVL